MKKLFAVLCTLTMLFSLAACSTTPATPSAEPSESASAVPSESAPAESSDMTISSADDLENKTIGVQLGTTGAIYAEDIPGVSLDEYSKGTDAIMALRQGKVDCVIIDDQPAQVFVEQNDDIMILDEPFEIEDYAICVSKDKPELTEAINTAIAELKADGTLSKLMDKYIEKVDGAEGYVSPEGTEYPNGTLIMATNAFFPPYEYYEGDVVVGLDAEFAKAICDKLGYDLVIDDMEFDSIILAVQSGKADFGAAGMSVTEERLVNIDFTDPYCTATQVIIVRK